MTALTVLPLERRRLSRSVLVAAVTAVVVVVAAIFGSTSGADAAGKGANKSVTITTLTGSGSTEDTKFPNDGDEYPIQLNGGASFTFTQPAGAVAQLVVTQTAGEVQWSNTGYLAAWCEGTVYVFDDDAPLGVRLDLLDQRGDHVGYPGYRTATNALAAPAVDRTVTLQAIVRENDGCDASPGPLDPDEPVADDDWWTVSIRVSVVLLQG